jgi:hypothetical protein
VGVRNDRIDGCFNSQHGFGKQIARDAGGDVLCPGAAVGTLAVAAVLELAGAIRKTGQIVYARLR